MNANGDQPPQNLARAFAMMQREVRTMKEKRMRYQGRIKLPPGTVTAKLPRALCPVCSRVWDYAIMPEDTMPAHRLCTPCKSLLRQGYTIFVSPGEIPLPIKSPVLKADGVAGKIVRLSKEEYDKLPKPIPNDAPAN